MNRKDIVPKWNSSTREEELKTYWDLYTDYDVRCHILRKPDGTYISRWELYESRSSPTYRSLDLV